MEKTLWLEDTAIGAAVVGLGIAAAAAIGWLAAQGNPVYVAIPIVALTALFLSTRPIWLLLIAVVVGLVISGLAQLYVPQLQLVRWALAPISLLLTLYALVETIRLGSMRAKQPVPAIVLWAFGFLLLTLVGGFLVHDFVPERFAIGLKGYFQVWGLLFALAFFPWPPSIIDRLPKLLLAVALIQLPFVLHQYIFLVPTRERLGDGIVPIDVVAGSFGATLTGGGANAVLNAFLTIVLAGLLAARQLKTLSFGRFALFALPIVIPIFLNEAKVSVLYIIAVLLVLYLEDLTKRPLRFLAGVASGTLLLLLLLEVYTAHAPDQAGVDSWEDLLRYTYEYNVANDEVRDELSRVGALRFWSESHGTQDLAGTFFGHGIGYTRVPDPNDSLKERVSASVAGIPKLIDLEQKIGNTAVAAILWEAGIVGLFCIIGLLIVTYTTAKRLEQSHQSTPDRVVAFRAIRAAMLVVFITLWHKNVLVFDVAYQTMLMLLIGYVAYWDRQGRPQTPSH